MKLKLERNRTKFKSLDTCSNSNSQEHRIKLIHIREQINPTRHKFNRSNHHHTYYRPKTSNFSINWTTCHHSSISRLQWHHKFQVNSRQPLLLRLEITTVQAHLILLERWCLHKLWAIKAHKPCIQYIHMRKAYITLNLLNQYYNMIRIFSKGTSSSIWIVSLTQDRI